jgi:hypothetical protein
MCSARAPAGHRPRQKKVHWHSTFGSIRVTEGQLRLGRRGPLLRPFCQRAQVHTRGYSTLLQRVLTDFGAETAFGQIPARVREHYGIDLPATSARQITLQHAHQVGAFAPVGVDATTATVIAECDGSLIPIVENELPLVTDVTAAASPPDRRRHKTLLWKEVRLCAAQAAGRVQARYAATVGSVLEAGLAWEQVTQRAGGTARSRVHGVGDGAPGGRPAVGCMGWAMARRGLPNSSPYALARKAGTW